MRQIMLALALLVGSLSAYAESEAKNDTVTVVNSKIQKIVCDTIVNSKGKEVVKYYVIYGCNLVPTSKSVYEAYNVCKKYNAECALVMVINKKTNKKRIILN